MPAAFDPVALLLRLGYLAASRPRIVVAFSGGMDSTVLVHALVKQRRKLGGLRLIHVDHGLQPASADWARRCATLARRWRVPLTSLRAEIRPARGESPEASARDARYRLLADAMQVDECLVTAQHRDDQAETLLLQLFRGAGVAGLAAMPQIAPFGPGFIARPMLDVSREEIATYARAHRLQWVDDPTNAETRFARNYLRHRVMPAIRERWPGVDAAIARSAAHMAEARSLLEATAHADLDKLADGAGISVTGLRALSRARRKNALRAFIGRAGVEMPATSQFLEIAGALLRARHDANPEQCFDGVTLRRRGGRLEVHVDSRVPGDRGIENAAKSWSWTVDRECVLNDARDTLALVDDVQGPIDLDLLPRVFEIRARRGGETLRPGPRARTQVLKKLLQSARVGFEERARMPLLFSGNHLIAAGDRWIDASIAANVKSRRRARLKWTRSG